jgi:lipopolysaccharide biosynthesis glycosyltransferase
MKNLNSDIHLAIAFDEGYVTPVYVFLTSLFANNTASSLIVHAIATGVSDIEKTGLQQFAREHQAEIIFYVIGPELTANFPLPDRPGAYITLATYYRLFFPQLIDQAILRLVYIDVDTLIVGNLSSLYMHPLNGKVIAAVQEAEMELRPDIEFPNLADYFNAGVLLIDLLQWRSQEITQQALNIIATYGERLKYHDQDALNLVFRGDWQRVDERFNLMKAYIPYDLPHRVSTEYLRDKVVIHYNGALKPWHRACENKLRFLYKKYLIQSPIPLSKRYAKKKINVQGVRRLFFSRALEMYFNYPEVAHIWRSIKGSIGK